MYSVNKQQHKDDPQGVESNAIVGCRLNLCSAVTPQLIINQPKKGRENGHIQLEDIQLEVEDPYETPK